jgi:hypothetical protein
MEIRNAVTERTNIPNAWVSCCFIAEKFPDSRMAQMVTLTEVPKVFLRFLNNYGRLFLCPFETEPRRVIYTQAR